MQEDDANKVPKTDATSADTTQSDTAADTNIADTANTDTIKADTANADATKADTTKVDTAKGKYQVILVEKAAAPEGLPGDNWYRYVIGEGGSKIEGLKPGSLKAVTEHARFSAEELNSRSAKGRSTYAPVKRVDPKK